MNEVVVVVMVKSSHAVAVVVVGDVNYCGGCGVGCGGELVVRWWWVVVVGWVGGGGFGVGVGWEADYKHYADHRGGRNGRTVINWTRSKFN